MTLVAANVRVGVSGAAFHAPLATALPTDATTAKNAAFKDTGYIADSGVKQSIGSDSTTIKAWGGDSVRKIETSHDLTYTFTMIETNKESLAAYYGSGNVTGSTAPYAVVIKSGANAHEEWILEIVDGAHNIRIVIPDGEMGERGDVTYATEEAIGYEVTITCYPDATGGKAYKYIT